MISLRREHAPAGQKPRCETCEGIELRRQGRVGFLQRVVLSRLGYFPWECGLCRRIVFLPQRTVIQPAGPVLAGFVEREEAPCSKAAPQAAVPLRDAVLQAGMGRQPGIAAR